MDSSLAQSISALKRGELIILVDDTSPTPRAFAFASASLVEERIVAFMARECGGIITAPLTEQRMRELQLSPMVERPSRGAPEFAISVEARNGVSTGISAADRAVTLRALATTDAPRRDLVTPGHIFPVQARDGGVLVRTSANEAAIDLLQLAALPPVGVLADCLNDSGELLTAEEIATFVTRHSLARVQVSELVRYRLATEEIVEKISEAAIPTLFAGEFRAICFRSVIDGAEHLALIKGDLTAHSKPVLARVQTEQLIGDLFGDNVFHLNALNTHEAIVAALQAIDARGCGVFVYIRHPRRGVLEQQVKAISQGESASSPMRQLREFGLGAQILRALGLERITLLSNSQRELHGLSAFRIEIAGHEPLGHPVQTASYG